MRRDSEISDVNNFFKVDRTYFDKISFFPKQFCLPKQIKLVDYHDSREPRDLKENIQIVDRLSLMDTNPTFRQIGIAQMNQDSADSGDGMISMMRNLKIRVAICITVYSEDKTMLKKTLEGIKRNYDTFFKQAGIQSHQIVVVIMFDGILHMNNDKFPDKNMFNLFRQFDLINGFRRKEYLMAKEKEEVIYHSDDSSDQQESLVNDIQNFADQMMFTEQQYQAIEDMLLQKQYQTYKSMLDVLVFAEQSDSQLHRLRVHQLPQIVQDAFADQAREYLISNGVDDVTQDNRELENYIMESLPQHKIERIKLEALKVAVKLARDFLKSRQTTSILYQMALPIQSSVEPDAKMNLFTVVKYSNKGKLSSHLWFFQGFCQMMNPDMCVLLDCGLEPEPDSIFRMWAHIQTYKSTCGGVCGYMKLRKESPYDQGGNRPQADAQSIVTKFAHYFVDIQKSQIFQYHFSHLLDKPFESLTGYIHVLPGAFSGYNWDALRSQKFKVIRSDGHVFEKDIEKRTKQQILKKYLKTVIYNEVLDDIAEANMYLAEDRILCLEIYTRKKNQFNLQYLPNAQAQVDPITTLPKLLNQRKRWINGSWFALEYVLQHKNRVKQSQHNCWDKMWFHFNMFHAEIMRIVAFISVALFFVTMHLMVLQFSQTTLKNYFMESYSITQQELVLNKIFYGFFSIRSVINSFTKVIDFFFIVCIGILVYRSLTIKRQDTRTKRSFNTISTWLGFYGIFSIVLIFVNFYEAVFNNRSDLIALDGIFTQRTFIYLLIAIVGAHFIIIITAFSLRTYYQIVTCLFSYFFYAASYVNLFFAYAFCRIDDLSWGTKGLDQESKSKQDKVRMKFTDQKIKFSLKWLGTNSIVSLVLIGLANNYDIQNYIIWIFSAYFAFLLGLKTLFVIIYQLKYHTITNYKVSKKIHQMRQKSKESSRLKKYMKEFIQKMKEQEIDMHIEQINEDIIRKRIDEEAYLNERNRVIEMEEEESRDEDRRISFKELKRISMLPRQSIN